MAQVDLEILRQKYIEIIEVHQRKLEAINILLEEDNGSVFGNSNLNKPIKVDVILNPQFPSRGNATSQALFIFNNMLKVGSKIKDVEEVYDECINQTNGDRYRMDNAIRRLLKEGKLVMVKYNENNKESYYGLPSWIGDNDFLDERKPTNNYLEINNVEIISNVK